MHQIIQIGFDLYSTGGTSVATNQLIKFQKNHKKDRFDKLDENGMAHARHYHSTCAVDLSYLVVTGGYRAGQLVEKYSLETRQWSNLPRLNKYRAEHESCCI